MCKVNIIIPAYNAHDTINQAIASVAMQDDIDNILLTIVDDASDESYDYLLSEYNYLNIEILRKNCNSGCGQSRQYGIDNTKCDYFMFLDADDCLYSANAVKILYQKIINDNLDMIISNFIEELPNGQFEIHENETVWMHGKLYKTSYVRNHNIRFNDTRYNEDHVFNGLMVHTGANVQYIDIITYIWKWYQLSLTRSSLYYINGQKDYLINAKYFIDELQKRNVAEEIIIEKAISYILNIYGNYNIYLYNNFNIECINNMIEEIKNYYFHLPISIKEKIDYKSIGKYMYTNPTINKILSNEVLFSVSIYEYINNITNYNVK